MSDPQFPVLEFPAMLHGLTGTVLRKVRAKGQSWTREYLKTGAFTQPQRMLQVLSGELLEVKSGILFDGSPHPRWRVSLFSDVFVGLSQNLSEEEYQRVQEAFESFCLSAPWSALIKAVSPLPLCSSGRMARLLTALLRFWDVLQCPRYAFWYDGKDTLEDLVMHFYGVTLEAWCPGVSASVREHLELTVERMARATREDCMDAVLRVMSLQVRTDAGLQHREVLIDPGFLRERLADLPPKDFENLSSAYRYSVNVQLFEWDRALGRK